MPKGRISITIDEHLSKEIQQYAQSKNLSKSEFIENVLRQWQKNWKREQMIEGYKRMANENLECVKDFALLGKEVWPHE
jgi:metal-responsive CopG/Arc/MetJ family transcriptional regulator